MKYLVKITRTEEYVHEVLVEAKNAPEARRKVQNYNDNDGFENLWNELGPYVDTGYEVTNAALCDADSLKYLEEVS